MYTVPTLIGKKKFSHQVSFSSQAHQPKAESPQSLSENSKAEQVLFRFGMFISGDQWDVLGTHLERHRERKYRPPRASERDHFGTVLSV